MTGRPRGRPHGDGGNDNVAGAQENVAARLADGRASAAGTDASQPASGRGSAGTEVGPDLAAARSFVDNVAADPRSVAGRSAEEIAGQFTAAGYPATVEQSRKRGTSGNAVQVRIERHPQVTNIQVHPGGGRHTPAGSPYWKISTSTDGKIWVVPADFRGADELTGKVVRYDE